MSLEKMGQAAREAAYQLATISTAQKNRALAAIADELEVHSSQILAANEKDIAAGREAGLSDWVILKVPHRRRRRRCPPALCASLRPVRATAPPDPPCRFCERRARGAGRRSGRAVSTRGWRQTTWRTTWRTTPPRS